MKRMNILRMKRSLNNYEHGENGKKGNQPHAIKAWGPS